MRLSAYKVATHAREEKRVYTSSRAAEYSAVLSSMRASAGVDSLTGLNLHDRAESTAVCAGVKMAASTGSSEILKKCGREREGEGGRKEDS
jgi:hypothetical protein